MQIRARPHSRSGFTLIELSIVLVIIGLIVGGVLLGQDLIRAAKIRSFIGEREKIATAMTTFKLKYNCIPGDCGTATNFLGSAGGAGTYLDGCVTAADTNKGATGTCNGSGNGKISDSGSFGGVTAEGVERFMIWQHLALAQLIAGQYGINGDGISYGHHGGANVPKSVLPNSIWAIYRADDAAALSQGANHQFAPGIMGKHALILGRNEYNSGGWWGSPQPLLQGIEASRIDAKYDDGMPFTGNITATFLAYGNNCTTSNSTAPTTPYFNTTGSSDFGCALVFPSGF